MDDRIEYIQQLQEEGYKSEPSQSMVLGNLYALITIVLVALSLIYYVTNIHPQVESKQAKKNLQEIKNKKHQEFLEERAKRIALSHKLNAKDYDETK